MGTKEKLIKRMKSIPKDFTFDEMRSILEHLGFTMTNKGKTSGSALGFEKGSLIINLHKPHPRKELPEYQIKKIITKLENEGLI